MEPEQRPDGIMDLAFINPLLAAGNLKNVPPCMIESHQGRNMSIQSKSFIKYIYVFEKCLKII